MALSKGPSFEELTREYFLSEGYFALRSVTLRAYGDEVTDIDVWTYRRQSTDRISCVIDVKNKKSPKIFERVLWTKGLQSITKSSRALVATTDANSSASRFAFDNGVQTITKSTIDKEEIRASMSRRMSLEDLVSELKSYEFQKEDGDWVSRIQDTKSSLVSQTSFQSFNRAMTNFQFFGERLITRPKFEFISVRCMLICASIAMIALDKAFEEIQFDDPATFETFLKNGIRYGDGKSERIRNTIGRILNLIESSLENGVAVGRQVASKLDAQFESVRADIITEYFSNPSRLNEVFSVALVFDNMAFSNAGRWNELMTSPSKAILGLLADFASIPRQKIFQSLQKSQKFVRVEATNNAIAQDRLL
jgi:hypothetical protein